MALVEKTCATERTCLRSTYVIPGWLETIDTFRKSFFTVHVSLNAIISKLRQARTIPSSTLTWIVARVQVAAYPAQVGRPLL